MTRCQRRQAVTAQIYAYPDRTEEQHAHTLSITVDQLQVECRSLEDHRVIERHGDRWRKRRSDIRAWSRGVGLV